MIGVQIREVVRSVQPAMRFAGVARKTHVYSSGQTSQALPTARLLLENAGGAGEIRLDETVPAALR